MLFCRPYMAPSPTGSLLANFPESAYRSPRSRSSGVLLILSAPSVRMESHRFSNTRLDSFAQCGQMSA